MCADCGEAFGSTMRCPSCMEPFVVCEFCEHGQVYCSEACKQAARERVVQRARRLYAKSDWAKRLASWRNQDYRAALARGANIPGKIETDPTFPQDSGGLNKVPDVPRDQVVSPVRAWEGPRHEVELEGRPVLGTDGVAPLAAHDACNTQCASPPCPTPAVQVAADDVVRRPSLDHCQFCGVLVRWFIERDALCQRAVDRRQSARSRTKRAPRLSMGPPATG